MVGELWPGIGSLKEYDRCLNTKVENKYYYYRFRWIYEHFGTMCQLS